MDIYEALDAVFDFFPKNILTELRNDGFYQPILKGEIKEGAEIYDLLEEKHTYLQDSDYTRLANSLAPILKAGSILQIGCGRGGLLRLLARLKFQPIYGIDRSQIMLKTAESRLKEFKNIFLIQSKIENFHFYELEKTDNIIINNFWGMICEEDSKQLLENLKECIDRNSLILIGPYAEDAINEKKEAAKKLIKEKLGFTLSYSFFKDFSKCGYDSEIIDVGQKKYFILKLN